VFLNDWAAAVPLGAKESFFGALNFAADAVFEACGGPLVGKPCHDLEMIVKVMFATAHPEYFDECFPALHKDSQKKDFQLAIARWKEVRKLEPWERLFAAAEGAQYETLKQLIFKYMLSVPADLRHPLTLSPAPAPAASATAGPTAPAPAPPHPSPAVTSPTTVPGIAPAVGGHGKEEKKRRGGK